MKKGGAREKTGKVEELRKEGFGERRRGLIRTV